MTYFEDGQLVERHTAGSLALERIEQTNPLGRVAVERSWGRFMATIGTREDTKPVVDGAPAVPTHRADTAIEEVPNAT